MTAGLSLPKERDARRVTIALICYLLGWVASGWLWLPALGMAESVRRDLRARASWRRWGGLLMVVSLVTILLALVIGSGVEFGVLWSHI